jgi:hypothetical protein
MSLLRSLRAVGIADPYHLHMSTAEDGGATWDAFLAKAPRTRYQQSTAWAGVKAGQGWRSPRVTVMSNGSIHGGARLQARPIPLAAAVGSVAGGPVLGSDDPALAAAAAEGPERPGSAADLMV